jgi:cytochrome P450
MNEHAQAAATAPLFNPLSPEFIRDPYPHYDLLRRVDPLHITPHGMYLASRHADVSSVLRDSASARISSIDRYAAMARRSWKSRSSAR